MRASLLAPAAILLAAALSPALAADSPTRVYSDPHGFSLRIPMKASVETDTQENGQLDLISSAAVVVSPDLADYKGSNLGTASVSVGVSNDSALMAACGEGKAAQGEKPAGTATLGGMKFNRFTFEDAEGGNQYSSVIYRGVSGGNCYELVEFLHWAPLENFSPGAVKEFNRTKVEDELRAITRSFALRSKAL